MKKCTTFTIASLTIVVLFPSVVLANVGTPLMWLEVGHLVILNLFIGALEGIIIWILFRTGIFRTIGILILANYFSAWAGYLGLLPLVGKIEHRILADAPLYNAIKFIAIMAVVAFILSIILEWPFCLWVLKKKPHRILKTLITALLINIASYAFLIWLYLSISTLTVYKNLSIDPNLTFPDAQKYWVYFVSPDDGDIYRIHPDGSVKTKMFDANIIISKWQEIPRLFVLPSADKTGYDLWAAEHGQREKNLLAKNFAAKTVLARELRYGEENGEVITEPNKLRQSYDFEFTGSDFRDPNSKIWTVYNEFWAWPGLVVKNKKTEQYFSIGLETPFLSWIIRSPIILPGDFVIFQLGGQIVLLDINKRKFRLVTLGRRPVVTMD